MDTRSRRQGAVNGGGGRPDWDSRVKDRIVNLKPDEIGYQKIISLKMNGRPQVYTVLETILEVKLDKPIPPRSKVTFDMDYEGWHPTPYVGREFYGVWGDFDVSISIDKKYMLGGTGYLQNPNQIGFGYEEKGTKVKKPAGEKLTWRFIAPNVHDFMWAADPEFIHVSRKLRDSLTIHVLYKPTNSSAKSWEDLLDMAEKALPFIEKTFGVLLYSWRRWWYGVSDGNLVYRSGCCFT